MRLGLLAGLIGAILHSPPPTDNGQVSRRHKGSRVVDLTPLVNEERGRNYYPGRTGGQRAHRAWKQARRVNGWRKS
jgi:hypothetical protein